MTTSPLIAIFVRHSAACKYRDDELWRRCNCRKHFRWTQNGVQHRQKAGTRSWAEAEEKKRQLEDQLAGRTPETRPEDNVKSLRDAVDAFLKEKRVEGVSSDRLGRYSRELDRFRAFFESKGVYVIQGINKELLTDYAATWEDAYPSTETRLSVRTRLRTFLKYCHQAAWLEREPLLPRIKVDEPVTMPLTTKEYEAVLKAILGTVLKERYQKKVRALIQLMRWSGLAIRDATVLPRSGLQYDKSKKVYRVETSRQKTGIHVCVPIPSDVAEELLAVPNSNPAYFFWKGTEDAQARAHSWQKSFIGPVFKAAGVVSEGNMVTHRLRDTFAVDLLSKGVAVYDVSKMLGHKNTRTTEERYAKWVKEMQDRLDTIVTGTWKKPKRKKARSVGA